MRIWTMARGLLMNKGFAWPSDNGSLRNKHHPFSIRNKPRGATPTELELKHGSLATLAAYRHTASHLVDMKNSCNCKCYCLVLGYLSDGDFFGRSLLFLSSIKAYQRFKFRCMYTLKYISIHLNLDKFKISFRRQSYFLRSFLIDSNLVQLYTKFKSIKKNRSNNIYKYIL
jgi:hypothetical protein